MKSPLRFLLLLLCLTSLACAARPDHCSADQPRPLRVLLVTGGCCHDYDAQKNLIKNGLEDRAHVEVTVVQQGGITTDARIPFYENAEWAAGFDVVIHDECFSDVKDSAWTQRVLKPHRDGVPAVVVHCAMHCYRDGTTDWFEFCGVTSHRHGAHYPHEVLNRDATHPIMADFGAGWSNPAGELYWIEKVWPSARPLASAKNRERDTEEVCVWTNDYHGTRVFGTTLGHHNETVQHPVFMELLTRGTLWAADKLSADYLKPVGDKMVPVNLALGKKATASSEETGKNNFAPHAIDGNAATRWCASSGSAPQWWQVDLGEPQTIKGIELKWESTNTIYRYQLEGSADGNSWQMLADESQNKDRDATHRLDAASIRFVRLTFLGSNTGGWASLWEVDIHGDEMRRVDPRSAQKIAEQASLADVKLPEGFEATLFAAPPAVNYPVFVAAAPDGTVYVSVDKNGSLDRAPNRGSVVRLRDLDGDGRADESKLFVANVDSPRGLVWDHDRLYLMHPPHLSAFIDHDGDGIADEQQVLVKNIAFGFKDRPADHTSNGVTLGIDGWLYLAIGDFGFMQAEGADGRKLQLRGGGVVRVRPDGTGMEVYSRGTRNILEVAVDPLLNGFTRDNTNDGGGWDIRLHHFTGLEQHGYPSLFMSFGDEIVKPLADYGGGSGCGALFMDEPGFPKGYGRSLYTADWGRNWVYRHALTPNGATFKPDQTEFAGLTRVTDLDVDALSHIYLTSWKGATFTYAGEEVGYLVRVSPQNYKPDPLPDFELASDEELVDLLKSNSHRRRLEAQRTLLRRGISEQTARSLESLATSSDHPLEGRVAAIFALKQGLGSKSHAFLNKLTADRAVRAYAIRALADRWDQREGIDRESLTKGLRDDDARIRLESVVALARFGRPDVSNPRQTSDEEARKFAARSIASIIDDADPVVGHTIVQALVRLHAAEACLDIEAGSATGESRVRAIRVLQSLHDPAVVDALITRLEEETDATRRRGLITALCRFHFREGIWKGNSWGTRPDTSGPYYQPETWDASPRIAAALKAALEHATGDEAAFVLNELSRHKVRLDGGVDRLLAMAAADSSLVPIALAEISRENTVSDPAANLLVHVANDAAAMHDLRSQAAIALLRSKRADAVSTAVDLLATMHGMNSDRQLTDTLWNAFRNSSVLDQHASMLGDTAKRIDGPRSLWAEAALLAIASSDRSSPESRELATKSLDEGWKDAKRRLQILEAALAANHRDSEDRVREALVDSDAKVAALARTIADAWKLPPEPTPAGPPISTMEPGEVVAQVLQRQGNIGRGEQLFGKLQCAKCHTVQQGEPLRGPHLPSVAKTYKREQLAEAVLLPSKSIAQGFVTNAFLLDSGKIITGFVTNEAADVVTIRDNKGDEIRLPVNSIEERVKQAVSVMPEGLVKDLTLEDFTSLVDYLQSLAN